MIKANELRIGNWVMEGIEFHKIDYRESDFFHVEIFEPIPLTPEILEKAGFVNSESIELFFELTGFKISDGKILHTHFKRDRGVQILNLHQLQNLYFALTGEEIEINL